MEKFSCIGGSKSVEDIRQKQTFSNTDSYQKDLYIIHTL